MVWCICGQDPDIYTTKIGITINWCLLTTSNAVGATGGSPIFGSILVTAPGGGGGGGAATNNSSGDGQDGASGGGTSNYNPVSGALSPEPTRRSRWSCL